MARKGKRKEASDHRKNAREVVFKGGSWDGKKYWVVYPCPTKLMMDMGREAYYLVGGSMNPPTYEYDPDRFIEKIEGAWKWQS